MTARGATILPVSGRRRGGTGRASGGGTGPPTGGGGGGRGPDRGRAGGFFMDNVKVFVNIRTTVSYGYGAFSSPSGAVGRGLLGSKV